MEHYYDENIINVLDCRINGGGYSNVSPIQYRKRKCICSRKCNNSFWAGDMCNSHTTIRSLQNIDFMNFITKYNLYYIIPIYEYPNYSTDEEISDIFKKRYRFKYNMKFNTYFVKMIQNIISFGKDDIICVKIKDSYKLLSETSDDEYKNVECIIIDNEPKFNDKYFVKCDDDNLEIFEVI